MADVESPKTPLSQGSVASRKSMFSPQDRHKKLREALTRASLLQENATVSALEMLEEAVTEVDDIHDDFEDLEEKIAYQDQVLLDSEVMKVSSHVIKGCMHSLSQETNPYSGVDFADKLLNYMSFLPDETSTEPNWDLLTREIAPLMKTCGSYSTILHCLEPIPKAETQDKKARAPRRSKDALAPAKRPENVKAIDNDDNPVDESVEKIYKLVKKYYKRNQQPLNFFRLIINPQDFGKTVQNMLHVAFLVRDGRMALSMIGGHLMINPLSDEQQEHLQGENVARIANVPTLDMQKWKRISQKLNITEPFITF